MKTRRLFGGGRLFLLLVSLSSVIVLICWSVTGSTGEQAYRHLIRVSVRVSLPLLLLAFVASALTQLLSGQFSTWLLRNRKYIGLAFSTVMLWQILFILLLISTGANIFPPGPAALFIISDLIGYSLLLAMTLTSFDFLKKRMSILAWKRLHKIGIYYIWTIYLYSFPIGIYFSRENLAEAMGYSFLFILTFSAGLLRFSAWMKNRNYI